MNYKTVNIAYKFTKIVQETSKPMNILEESQRISIFYSFLWALARGVVA